MDDAEKKAEGNLNSESNEKQCRICLQEDDNPNSPLDRLFRPCLCKGTMAYVHGRCLDQWRRHSVKASSKYRCDQCGYEYQMSRLGSPIAIEVARVVKTEWFCQLASIWLLLFVIYFVGFMARLYRGKEVAPDVLSMVLMDMVDGAILVGPISFTFSALFWLFEYGGAGFRGMGGYGRWTGNDKDCGKMLFFIIVLVGLAFAFRFLYRHTRNLVDFTASSAASHILDIRDVQPAIDLGEPPSEWPRKVYTVVAAGVLLLIVGSTALALVTLTFALWIQL